MADLERVAALLRLRLDDDLDKIREVGETIERNLREDPHFYDPPVGGTASFIAKDGTTVTITLIGEEITDKTEILYTDSRCGEYTGPATLAQAAAHTTYSHGGIKQ